MGKHTETTGSCELCGRSGVVTTVHHLTPKEEGGSFLPTANLCIPCHKQLHATFTNEQLAVSFNTISALQADPAVMKFVKWIRKQPESAVPRVKKSRDRRQHSR